jgi:hypothetical protein
MSIAVNTTDDTSQPQATNTSVDSSQGGDGLGAQWVQQLFGNSSAFPATESVIQFSVQSGSGQDTTDSMISRTLGSDSTPSSATGSLPTQSGTTEESKSSFQGQMLLDGIDDLEEDPRDTMIHIIDMAMQNIGASMVLFNDEEKLDIKQLWMDWQLVTWIALEEAMADIGSAKAILSDTIELLKKFYSGIDS